MAIHFPISFQLKVTLIGTTLIVSTKNCIALDKESDNFEEGLAGQSWPMIATKKTTTLKILTNRIKNLPNNSCREYIFDTQMISDHTNNDCHKEHAKIR